MKNVVKIQQLLIEFTEKLLEKLYVELWQIGGGPQYRIDSRVNPLALMPYKMPPHLLVEL